MSDEPKTPEIPSSPGDKGNPIRGEHDAAYKRMFSHPEMVVPFLRKFVLRGEDAGFDFSTLEPVKTSFISSTHQSRDSDAIWRLRQRLQGSQAGDWTYVYFQLEFQSKPERFMAVRALNYLCLLYEHLIQKGELTHDGLLPPVLPIVLYNGSRPWKKPVTLAELIGPTPEAITPYLPSFRFLLIDEGRWPKEDLDASENPASALVALEQARHSQELVQGVQDLVASTDVPSMESLRSDMIKWISRSLLPLRFPEQTLSTFLETPHMLSETVKEWPSQWLAEGREQGLLEGREQGLVQGREQGLRDSLSRQLGLKFGDAAMNAAQERLEAAGEATLLSWTERILTASTLEDLFRD